MEKTRYKGTLTKKLLVTCLFGFHRWVDREVVETGQPRKGWAKGSKQTVMYLREHCYYCGTSRTVGFTI